MTYGWHWHCLLGRNISRTTANNVHIIRICQIMCGWHLHMQITCEQCPDATCRETHQHRLSHKSFTWFWNETTQHSCDKFHSIASSCQSRKIVQVHADHEEFCRWHVDDICACRRCVDDVHACGQHADDVPDDICHPPAKSPMKSHSRVICTSSACCPHVICTSSAHRPQETSSPKIFQVKYQSNSSAKNWHDTRACGSRNKYNYCNTWVRTVLT